MNTRTEYAKTAATGCRLFLRRKKLNGASTADKVHYDGDHRKQK